MHSSRRPHAAPVRTSVPLTDSRTAAAIAMPGENTVEGFVDGPVDGGIAGWAIRCGPLGDPIPGSVELAVLCDGEPIGRIAADRSRPDVAEAKGCAPAVGFHFRPPAYLRTGRSHAFCFRALPEGNDLVNSPLEISFPTTDRTSGLHALHETARNLCAEVWSLERRIQQMLANGPCTLSGYDGWARRTLVALRQAVAAHRPDSASPDSASPDPGDAPLVSVVMPVFRPDLGHFEAAVHSVRAQTWRNWELLVVDDGSRSAALTACMRGLAAADPRVRLLRHAANRGISAATNTAISKAGGAYVALLDHDDLLVDVALELMVTEAQRTGAALVYSDEDKIDDLGRLTDPHFKPDFNWRLLLGMNYLCHLTLMERSVLRRAGPLHSAFDGAQDHDLFLRISELVEPAQIHHVPHVLYHWRKSPRSAAGSAVAKPHAAAAGAAAVRDHLHRRGFARAAVSAIANSTMYAVDWGLAEQPSVVVIIPFRDQAASTRRCLDLLLANTDYANLKVVLVDNWSLQPETHPFCAEASGRPGVATMRVEEGFNFSRLNNRAAAAHPADYYVFLNNDVFVTQRDWLRRMVNEALADPAVAIVGAKLVYPNGTLQHAGVVLGIGGVADHAFKGIAQTDPGYVGRALLAQQYSAVTAAMMLCRADAFAALGGFDEADLTIAFNDVDLCLKAGRAGHKVVWTADVTAEHHESLSRGADDDAPRRARFFHEHQVMLRRWGAALAGDPFYNANFSRQGGLFSELADPEAPGAPA